MTISSAFTIDGSLPGDAIAIAPGATVTFEIVSLTGIAGIEWSIVGNDSALRVNPAITLSGSPQGSSASLVMPADVGDGLGQSYRVQCTVSDGKRPPTKSTTTRIIGIVNANGVVPFSYGEETDRDDTRGWAPTLNRTLVSGGNPHIDTGSAAERGWIDYQASSDAAGARFTGKKSAGTPEAPSNPQAGAAIVELTARPYLDTAFIDAGTLGIYKFLLGSAQSRFALSLHDGDAVRVITNTVTKRITTSDATPTTAITLPTHRSSLLSYAARWFGVDAESNMVFLEQTGVYRRFNTAAPTVLGAPSAVFPLYKDDGGVGNPTVIIVGLNLLFQVTGKAATNYTWDVEVTWREMAA